MTPTDLHYIPRTFALWFLMKIWKYMSIHLCFTVLIIFFLNIGNFCLYIFIVFYFILIYSVSFLYRTKSLIRGNKFFFVAADSYYVVNYDRFHHVAIVSVRFHLCIWKWLWIILIILVRKYILSYIVYRLLSVFSWLKHHSDNPVLLYLWIISVSDHGP